MTMLEQLNRVEIEHAAAKEEWRVQFDRATDPAIKGQAKAEARRRARAAWWRYVRRCEELQEYMDNRPDSYL